MKIVPLILILLLVACGESSNEVAKNTNNTEVAKTEPTTEQSTPKLEFTSLEEAITNTKPDMGDFEDTNFSKGAALLGYWASDKLKWSDLQKIEPSKYALVMKDPDAERGKRLCVYGNIVEIQVDNTLPNKVKIYLGGIADDSFRLYRFVAVGSTGDLVAGSQAKFCGIVTGKNSYQNSAGGVSHAVHLVGMFDLPENSKI